MEDELKHMMSDHDLLIVLYTKMGRMQLDLKEIKDGTVADIAVLKTNKVEKSEYDKKVEDLEVRLRKTEERIVQIFTWGSAGVIALGLIEFIANLYFKV